MMKRFPNNKKRKNKMQMKQNKTIKNHKIKRK